jgi:hypothetical protein
MPNATPEINAASRNPRRMDAAQRCGCVAFDGILFMNVLPQVFYTCLSPGGFGADGFLQ